MALFVLVPNIASRPNVTQKGTDRFTTEQKVSKTESPRLIARYESQASLIFDKLGIMQMDRRETAGTLLAHRIDTDAWKVRRKSFSHRPVNRRPIK